MSEAERILELCEDCGRCVKICAFLRHYCDSPRELAKRFQRNIWENIETPHSCSLCGLCRTVCRLDLCSGDMCLEAREAFFQTGAQKGLPRDFVYDYMIPKHKGVRNHQIMSSSSVFTLDWLPKTRDGKAPKRVFFPGCSLSAYSPELVISSYKYLRDKFPGMGIILDCCGKPSLDIGDRDLFQRIFNKVVKKFSSLGIEEVVLACVNCVKTFAENSGIRTRTIYEVMSERGLPKSAGKVSARRKYALKTTSELLPDFVQKVSSTVDVTIHDSCPARHSPEIRDSARDILSQMGFNIEEMKLKHEMTQCCGAGGCAPVGNPALADRHSGARASQAKSLIVTYCAHCRETFSSRAPSLHILDLVFGSGDKNPLRERRDSWENWLNRWLLKKKFQLMNTGLF